MVTFIIGLIVAAVIYAAAHKMYSDKKKGRSPSGCNCQGCANSHICHGSKEK